MKRSYSHIVAVAVCLAATYGSVIAQRTGAGALPGQGPQGKVSGMVIDSTADTPLAGASVALWSAADSTLITGAIAERNGTFSIGAVPPGTYYAKITYVGRTTRIVGGIAIRPDALQVDLGRIMLAVDVARQQEITVTAERDFMTVGIDRTIYKTGDLAVSSGGNATDVLRNLPQVEVDANGTVSLRGNQNVAVQLNGRPMVLKGEALTAFLRGLPSSAIERVEVVTNPSAKYDPEGMGGIINIVLDQKTSRGLSGNITGSASSNNNYNVGGSLAYGDGPWNIFGSYSFYYGSRNASGDRYRRTYAPGMTSILEQHSDDDGTYPGHSINASVDYTFGANTLSLVAVGGLRNGEELSVNHSRELDAAGTMVQRYDRSATANRDGVPMDYRLGYKLVLEPSKHELSAEVRFGTESSEVTTDYIQNNLVLDGAPAGDSLPVRQRSADDNTVTSYSVQLDYVRSLWDGSRLETGYKGEVEGTKGDFTFGTFDNATATFQPDAGPDNAYDYRREIHAAYGTLGQELGDFSVQVGVRLEQAQTRFNALGLGQSFDNDYFSAFPSVFLNYKASDALQLKASYSRRVQRPWIQALNPTINFVDPTFRESGNPSLKPEYTNTYELSAVYFAENGTLTLTPFYRQSTDIIRRYDITDSNDVSTVTFLNFDTNESYGADLIGTVRVRDWLNAFASASAYRTVTNAGNIQEDLGSDGFIWMLRGNATFTLMKGLDLQASYFYRAPMTIEGGRIGSWSSVDLSIQQRVFGDRGRVGLRVSDPFNWMGFNVVRDDSRFYQKYDRTWNSRSLFLTFSYNFGNQSAMPRRDRGQQPQPGGGGLDGYGM